MKFLAFALVAVAAAGCVSEGPSQRSAPKLSRADLLCEAAGFTPGSADYRQCRAIAELETSIRDEEKAERVARETIGDGLAIEICERFSRRQIRYPIVRRASARHQATTRRRSNSRSRSTSQRRIPRAYPHSPM
ncbi:MAG: hypothetical protein HPM95_16130 [Alphaproteobacteria bacterium]|nr:hypothetical protein [Alphaproteobacteria bacterium]